MYGTQQNVWNATECMEFYRMYGTLQNVWNTTECMEYYRMYGTLQKIVGKANKNDSVVLIGDMKAGLGNVEVTNVVGANGEAA